MHYTYTEDGQTRQYSDRKRYLWLLALSTPFLLTLAIWAFVQTGQHWLLACPIVYLYGVLPVLDYVLGEDINNPPEAVIPQLEADRYYTRLLLLTVPGLVLNVVVAGYAVTQLDLSGWLIALVTLTSGVISGGLGLTISHELGHRGGKFERFAALVASSVSLYGHFNIEHNRGHHVNVATPEDCASSRFNETLYQFSWREQWGALVRGWRSECQRLNAKKLAIWSVHNQILQSYAMTLVLWGISVALFGWSVLWFLIAQSYVGQWHLTLANYVEHY
ncbi:MAG: alkane 1-monooxygenase, partial [Gammaproteobacteria bacterium]|nr:alkane 1-monooxygenase [Gammaproteobacteria bacterium]